MVESLFIKNCDQWNIICINEVSWKDN